MYKKILLPTDGSEYANKAAKHAIWLARLNGAELIALNVIETSSLVGLPAEDLIVRIKEMLKEEGRKSLEKISDILKESKIEDECQKEVKLTLSTKEGSPSDIIINTVKEEGVDLIVMGTSGKHGLDRFLLGSVTENVVRSSQCPVLVVH
ncbi:MULTISPECIES: universal stress protein [Methanobacterium]|jgi:nucleotide-binding universal stress UspA family protein|uniref:Universal stress protein n=1 Tax=Methanobacterium veterum TaxID=408577 RepID=A0A9E5A426_9EURY|nr:MULTISPECIES: universal stress protein [Methanobacterium]MCZ3365049.1 universal stress protein [Methanobacterium veterum]MCZ3372804.1 universal stress protein [Methanobacterium veterum]